MNDNSEVWHTLLETMRLVDKHKKWIPSMMRKTHQIMKLNLCRLSSFICCFYFNILISQEKKSRIFLFYWNDNATGWIHEWITFITKSQAAFFASSFTIHYLPAIIFLFIWFCPFLRLWAFLCLHFLSFLPSFRLFLSFWHLSMLRTLIIVHLLCLFRGKKCGTFDL